MFPELTPHQQAVLSQATLVIRGGERWRKLDRHTIFTGPGTEPLDVLYEHGPDEGLRELFLFPGDQAALGFFALDEADRVAKRMSWVLFLTPPDQT